jgi:hypothetical protein
MIFSAYCFCIRVIFTLKENNVIPVWPFYPRNQVYFSKDRLIAQKKKKTESERK